MNALRFQSLNNLDNIFIIILTQFSLPDVTDAVSKWFTDRIAWMSKVKSGRKILLWRNDGEKFSGEKFSEQKKKIENQ